MGYVDIFGRIYSPLAVINISQLACIHPDNIDEDMLDNYSLRPII